MQEKYNKQIAIWLSTGALLVLAMVVIGGITRLTHSGLSIVTWQPIKGVLPPLNQAEWQKAFDAYKQIPEYRKVHNYFTIEDYKRIFFWEYLHRMLGRFIGLVFIIPFLYFRFSGKLPSGRLRKRLLIIFLLGAMQGLVGWYMVKSGLVENTSVDHVRLALHMSVALIVISVIFWTVLELLFKPLPQGQYIIRFRKNLFVAWVLVIIQIIYGGLTAGLKAGLVFPTYPKMGNEWLPGIASKVFREEGIGSLVNFPVTVQFIHRWLGFIILLVLLYMFIRYKRQLGGPLSRILRGIIFLVGLQFTLGVTVILFKVPVRLAVLHQLTAFILYLSLLSGLFFSSKKTTAFT